MDKLLGLIDDHKHEMKEQLYIDIMNCIMMAKVSVLRVTLHITNIHLEADYHSNEIDICDTIKVVTRIIRYKNHRNTYGLDKFMAKPFKPFRIEHVSDTDIEGLNGIFDTENHSIVLEGSDLDDPSELVKIETHYDSYNIVYVTAVEEITADSEESNQQDNDDD
jgi:hypothetical protein